MIYITGRPVASSVDISVDSMYVFLVLLAIADAELPISLFL